MIVSGSPADEVRNQRTMTTRNIGLNTSCLVFLVTFGLFVKTNCPVVYVGDSGELTAAAHVLGVAHPSGYPLYVLLVKAMQLLPVASIVARSNLFSALTTALAASVFVNLFHILGVRRLLSVALSFLIVLSSVIWSEATVARVYGLNLLFTVLLLRAAFTRRVSFRNLLLFALVAGLALANHLQSLFTVVPAGLFLLLRSRSILTVSRLGTMLLPVLIGLSVYLEMPIRSSVDPVVDWRNPETFDAFMSSISRRDYWKNAAGISENTLYDEGLNLVQILEKQYPVWVLLLAVCGWFVLLIRRPDFAAVVILNAIGNTVMLARHGSRYDLFGTDRYHIPFIVCFFLGLTGIGYLLSIRRSVWMRWIGGALAIITLIGLPVRNDESGDRSGAFVADDLAFNLQALLPHGSTVFLYADGELFPMACLRITERFRDDLMLIDRTGSIFQVSQPLAFPKLKNSPERAMIEEALIDRNPDHSYCSFVLNETAMTRYTPIPHGFIYRFVPLNWKIQPLPEPPKFARNRPMTPVVENDHMVRLIIDEMYIPGSRSYFTFGNLVRTAGYFTERLETGKGSPADALALAELYTRANLKGGSRYYRQLAQQMQVD